MPSLRTTVKGDSPVVMVTVTVAASPGQTNPAPVMDATGRGLTVTITVLLYSGSHAAESTRRRKCVVRRIPAGGSYDAMVAPGTLLQVLPLSRLRSHWKSMIKPDHWLVP
ncbi:MAG: hypothetical protein R2758_04205 [Bacteroidales bacterium]